MKRQLLLLLISLSGTCFAQRSFNVHFDTDKFNLTTDAVASLDSFIATTSSQTQVRLFGHCDIMADYVYNDALSVKRTHAVKNYLVSKGLNAAAIIEEKGFGKRRPLNSNHGEREMFLNRRVEVIVIGEPVVETSVETDTAEMRTAVKEELVNLTKQLTDTTTKVGSNIVVHNLNFYGGTHVILPESFPLLMELANVMKNNPTLEIAVEGHICCMEGDVDGFDMGTHTNNLSENRAKEICYYLSRNGVASNRLKYRGFGHQQPLYPYPEKSEQERILNRRVEIKILAR